MNKILLSNKSAYKHLKNITINQKAIELLVSYLSENLHKNNEFSLFNKETSLVDGFNLILIFNVMNFCYWAEKDLPKWSIKINGDILDGAIALFRLLEKQAFESPKFLDWNYLCEFSYIDFENIFTKSNVEIPLMKERYTNLISLAKDMVRDYDGDSSQLIRNSHHCAARMLKRISSFSSFEDKSVLYGKPIFFLKRAQLQIKMFDDFQKHLGYESMQNLHILTAFADYKVPQLLRHLGILNYSEELSETVDNYNLIAKDSVFENEIRIASIIAVDEIKRTARSFGLEITSSQIDSLLWNRAASNKDPMKPYHRTYTTAY